MQLQDIAAIVTGAAQGLGLAFAKLILDGGGRAFLTDINSTALEAAARELQAVHGARVGFCFQDVTDDSSFDKVFDAASALFGCVNVLVNNAGINCPYYEFYKAPGTGWRKLVEINLISVMRGTQVALRRLTSPGVIVNVASAAAFHPTPSIPEYGTTKAAVVSFTRAVAARNTGIRVVAFCPAFVDTAMGRIAVSQSPQAVAQFGGVMTCEYAAEAFKTAVLDESNNGQALLVTPRHHVTAIVTGAGQGLGLAFTTALLAQGARIFMTDINLDIVTASCAALEGAHHGRVACSRQDVCDDASFAAAFDAAERQFGPVNVLINNAGVAVPFNSFYDEPTSDAWRKLMEINVVAVMRGTQEALHRLQASSVTDFVPIVVNISSVSAMWPVAELPEYSTSKAAVVAFSTAVGKRVEATNVRVVSICPAFTNTAMGRAAEAGNPAMVGHLGQLMTPEFVAQGVVQLVTDRDNSGRVMIVTNRGIKYRGGTKPSAKL
ncbi:15-hydroxyprostaglandin dehydrogenase NAD(+)-like [Achlya hypogyna]|uniref:15-hydroxyprostaglandin dehydrogenase NAD(+)-like n=1 Tax=Achlya hypogyna TaxID=1202772 RepID=A0A1V9YTC2_ACHHY|nr:15-hydroxyprostaglandin dehydrogenase NAD(+)-like [Achlya hypogyna]